MKKIILFFFASALVGRAQCQELEFINISISNGRSPIVDLSTNLPENMELSIELSPITGGFLVGSDEKVHNGHIKTKPLLNDGQRLPAGEYLLQVTSALPQFQSDPSIATKYGDLGQKLKGPDVEEALGIGRTIQRKEHIRLQ